MPNWAGSCWYYLRYLDPGDDERMVDPELEQYWLGPREPGDVGGVDLYVGGVEHAVLHLLYARFWHKVLFDLGYVSSEEPFRRLVNQGYISAFAYTDERGFYVPAAEVVEKDGQFFYEGKPVNREYGKIGKSLKNMVTPDEMIGAYGADTFRVYEMSTGPLDQSRPWETKAVVGSQRLLQRIWRVVVDEQTGAVRAADVEPSEDTLRALHRAIDGVRDGFATLRFNIAIARITELTNHLTSVYGADTPVPRSVAAEPLVLLSRRWRTSPRRCGRGWATTTRWPGTPFPVADERWLVDDTVQVAVQVNGKVRAQVSVPADADAAPWRRRPGRTSGSPATWTARPCAASSPSPAGWSTSSSAESAGRDRRCGCGPVSGGTAAGAAAATQRPWDEPYAVCRERRVQAVGADEAGRRPRPIGGRGASATSSGAELAADEVRGRFDAEPWTGRHDRPPGPASGPDAGASDRDAGAPEGECEADVGPVRERGHPRRRARRPGPASSPPRPGRSPRRRGCRGRARPTAT